MQPLTEQQIRDIVKQEIQASNSALRFQQTPIPKHIHNGLDAPFAFNPVFSYVGVVGLNGEQLIMPNGWSVQYLGTGVYQVTHNLGTDFYVAVVSPILSVTLPIASVTPGPNVFDVTWTDTLTSSASDTAFSFIVVNVTNKKTNPQLYSEIAQ